MIDGSRQMPVHHLTIRVPWHDNGWKGTFCNNPCANTSCTILPRITTNRDDAYETKHAGKSIERLSREQLPPCVDEHCTIMAPFSLSMVKNPPYTDNAKITHGHFADTPYTIRPYSASAVPFRWMLREQIEGNQKKNIPSKAEQLQFDYQYEQPLFLAGVERFPDFTIADDDTGITWYWEHNGMLSSEAYRQRWERKLNAYRQQDILPLSEGGGRNGTLLTTEEKEDAGLSADQIKANIEAILGE